MLQETKQKALMIGIMLALLFAMIMLVKKCNAEQQLSLVESALYEQQNQYKLTEDSYAKRIEEFNTERKLIKNILASNAELSDVVAKSQSQNNKILAHVGIIATFVDRPSEPAPMLPIDSIGNYKFDAYYPDKKNSFIHYTGITDLKSKQILGNWSFNKLKLNVVMTERQRGTWDAVIQGPDYFVVDSILVSSLPLEKFTDKYKLGFVAGGGISSSYDIKKFGLNVGAGLNWKAHTILLNASTMQQLSLSYYYKFIR